MLTRKRGRIQLFVYFNSHFAWHAPESPEMFRDLWSKGER